MFPLLVSVASSGRDGVNRFPRCVCVPHGKVLAQIQPRQSPSSVTKSQHTGVNSRSLVDAGKSTPVGKRLGDGGRGRTRLRRAEFKAVGDQQTQRVGQRRESPNITTRETSRRLSGKAVSEEIDVSGAGTNTSSRSMNVWCTGGIAIGSRCCSMEERKPETGGYVDGKEEYSWARCLSLRCFQGKRRRTLLPSLRVRPPRKGSRPNSTV